MLNLRNELKCKIIFFYIDNRIVKGRLFEILFYFNFCVRVIIYYFMLLLLDRVNIKFMFFYL